MLTKWSGPQKNISSYDDDDDDDDYDDDNDNDDHYCQQQQWPTSPSQDVTEKTDPPSQFCCHWQERSQSYASASHTNVFLGTSDLQQP